MSPPDCSSRLQLQLRVSLKLYAGCFSQDTFARASFIYAPGKGPAEKCTLGVQDSGGRVYSRLKIPLPHQIAL